MDRRCKRCGAAFVAASGVPGRPPSHCEQHRREHRSRDRSIHHLRPANLTLWATADEKRVLFSAAGAEGFSSWARRVLLAAAGKLDAAGAYRMLQDIKRYLDLPEVADHEAIAVSEVVEPPAEVERPTINPQVADRISRIWDRAGKKHAPDAADDEPDTVIERVPEIVHAAEHPEAPEMSPQLARHLAILKGRKDMLRRQRVDELVPPY